MQIRNDRFFFFFGTILGIKCKKEYHTVGIIPKCYRKKNVQRGKIDITSIHYRSLSCLGTGTSIKTMAALYKLDIYYTN